MNWWINGSSVTMLEFHETAAKIRLLSVKKREEELDRKGDFLCGLESMLILKPWLMRLIDSS